MSRSICLLVVALFIAFSTTPGFADRKGIINIAHRGARSLAPENTLEAFRIALEECGTDWIELDVHLSKDGRTVVVHDDTLERCSDVQVKFPDRAPWRVGDFTFAELRTLDAGRWFVNSDPYGQIAAGKVSPERVKLFETGSLRIPTLREVLDLAKGHKGKVNIEIKNYPSFYQGITLKVIGDIKATGMEKDVLISSFDHEILHQFKMLAPRLPRAALCDQPVFPLKEYLVDCLGAAVFNPGGDLMGFRSVEFIRSGKFRTDLIAAAHEAGLQVFVWTVNERAHLQALIDAGVDGIFTDFPQLLSEMLKP